LHIKDGEKIIDGAHAFLYVWKNMPKYKFLYIFFKTPIIFNIFSFFYEIIAFFLYHKNKKQIQKEQ
jgi:predicted DCC family thiol-disulfide oxidoreductase YuxK